MGQPVRSEPERHIVAAEEPHVNDDRRRPHPFYQRAAEYLGLERNVMVMVAAGSLQGLGTMLWQGYTVKVLDALGAASWMTGLYLATGGLTGALAPYPGGLLSDRLGRGRTLILGSVLALAGFTLYLVAPTWWMFIPATILAGFAGSIRFTGSLALTGDRLREYRRAISVAVQNVVGRLATVISPPLGGALIAYMVVRLTQRAEGTVAEERLQTLGLLYGFRWAVAITIVLTAVAILLQRRYYKLPPAKRDDGPLHPVHVFWSMGGELKRLLLADSLVRVGSRLYIGFIPLYILNVLRRGYVEWGSLQAVMAATSILLYIPAAKLADRGGRASRRPFVTATLLFFSAFPLVLVLAPSATVWLVPVFIIGGLRELGEPARKALIMDLAQGSGLGRQIGTYNMVRGIAMSLSPLIGGLLYGRNPVVPFVVGGFVSGLGLLWFVLEGMLFRPQENEFDR